VWDVTYFCWILANVCGVSLESGRSYCASCAITAPEENLIEVAKLGRVAGHSPEARARQAEKQHRHAPEAKTWDHSDNPHLRTVEVYREKTQPGHDPSYSIRLRPVAASRGGNTCRLMRTASKALRGSQKARSGATYRLKSRTEYLLGRRCQLLQR